MWAAFASWDPRILDLTSAIRIRTSSYSRFRLQEGPSVITNVDFYFVWKTDASLGSLGLDKLELVKHGSKLSLNRRARRYDTTAI